MAKRMQEQKEENRIVAKSMPTAMTLVSSVLTRSSSVNSPIASRIPGIFRASSRPVGLSWELGANTSQNSNPDAASSFPRMAKGCSTVHKQSGTCSNWVPRISRKSGNSRRFRRFGTRKSNLATSFQYVTRDVDHMEKVFWITRKTHGRKPTDDLKGLRVISAFCCFFF